MSLVIKQTQDGYMASVTPPHVQGGAWSNPQPLSRSELVQELLHLGCHQTDIGDAFYAADPQWLER